ncbi:MAG: DUF2116 family Zn-ribbon domain-containing protein [Deltaproteobacteria bacterium]|nr:DUF2116 family Zn-ribbon domain-containing protein [Deltaproteobacteria bacterium]
MHRCQLCGHPSPRRPFCSDRCKRAMEKRREREAQVLLGKGLAVVTGGVLLVRLLTATNVLPAC